MTKYRIYRATLSVLLTLLLCELNLLATGVYPSPLWIFVSTICFNVIIDLINTMLIDKKRREEDDAR